MIDEFEGELWVHGMSWGRVMRVNKCGGRLQCQLLLIIITGLGYGYEIALRSLSTSINALITIVLTFVPGAPSPLPRCVVRAMIARGKTSEKSDDHREQ